MVGGAGSGVGGDEGHEEMGHDCEAGGEGLSVYNRRLGEACARLEEAYELPDTAAAHPPKLKREKEWCYE